MKVLLISPLPKLDPAGGDITYTQTLLAHPPEGVEYETYAEALSRGTLREHARRDSLHRAIKTRSNILGEAKLTVASRLVNSLRKRNFLFREPHRFFSVEPGAYDLIHMHVFSAKFFNLSCPLVVSNAAPLRYVYSEAFQVSKRRTDRMERIDIALAKMFGINLNSYYLPQATRVIAMTEFLKKWYTDRNITPDFAVDVVPIYLPLRDINISKRQPKRIGFIAKEFQMKGGETLLKAFDKVRASCPEVELTIVGSQPQLPPTEAKLRGITWLPYVDREKLLTEILPSFDVLAYPTRFDGLPLVVLEAMAAGVAVATSDYQAMPEIISYGETGLISPVGSVKALADNIVKLLDPEMNLHYRGAARAQFETTYSSDVVRPQLRKSYESAISGAK